MVQSSRLRSDGFILWLPRHLFPGHPQNCWYSSKGQLCPPQKGAFLRTASHATQVCPGHPQHAKDTFFLPKKTAAWWQRDRGQIWTLVKRQQKAFSGHQPIPLPPLLSWRANKTIRGIYKQSLETKNGLRVPLHFAARFYFVMTWF